MQVASELMIIKPKNGELAIKQAELHYS